ncbi:MAG: 3-deoxy-7-phosphoheptulonate synthase [Bacillota bacterium]
MACKLASRKRKKTVVRVGEAVVGGDGIVVIAGPCAVENRDQYLQLASQLKKVGVRILRGGAFKPRTSPYDFQGFGREGLSILAEARKLTGLAVVTEVMDTRDVETVAQYVDIVQIGSRNMHNYNLLKEVGRVKRPVLLKRGPSATIKEWLLAAEYIMLEGNRQVIMCERGIRTYERFTRNTLDISAIPVIKHLSHLPVVVDPSHASGKWNLISALSKGSVAAGADGLIIEVHPNPRKAMSDGMQSLMPGKFAVVLRELKPVAEAVGRQWKYPNP